MPLFGGHKRPPLDGLTKEEERRRDALTPQLTLRTEGKEGYQGEAVLGVLQEKANSDKADFLWPLLVGWQLMRMRHFTAAIASFNEAVRRDEGEVRSTCGAGTAYMQAGQAAQSLGAGVTEAMVPANMSPEDLYHEAGRCFKAALGLTSDKDELARIHSAEDQVEQALARSVKHH